MSVEPRSNQDAGELTEQELRAALEVIEGRNIPLSEYARDFLSLDRLLNR